MKKKNAYEIVIEQVLNAMNEGEILWRKPWSGADMIPKNLISNKAYSGFNFFLLQLNNFESNYFLTFNQIKNKGGKLKKGSKGLPVVFFKMIESKKDPEKKIPVLRYYRVFNLDQTEGIEVDSADIIINNDFNPIEEAENMLAKISNFHAPIENLKSNRAFYSPMSDRIQLPVREQFEKEEEYYSTLFHEIIHSTGAEYRLNRETLYKSNTFGDHAYSEEELVAEMGAAFLCALTGISNETIENSKAYIKGWLKVFKNDPKMIYRAAREAQKAVDYLLSSSHEEIQ